MAKATTVAEVIAAEAGGTTKAERQAEMRAIASVIDNRATQLGVAAADVVAEGFDAYGKAMPAGTSSLVNDAQAAIGYVDANGSTVGNSTYYSTHDKVGALARGAPNASLREEDKTAAHTYFTDENMAPIKTAAGVFTPSVQVASDASLLSDLGLSVAEAPPMGNWTDVVEPTLASAIAQSLPPSMQEQYEPVPGPFDAPPPGVTRPPTSLSGVDWDKVNPVTATVSPPGPIRDDTFGYLGPVQTDRIDSAQWG
ncbi:MAG: hypothetical protein GY727_06625, partial [Gammaproteobacteria bacterium]|nr:hypothetical protein [Gammaproteobacteria bacterium]